MEKSDYEKLISEIVKKQIDILGPDIALMKANGVDGLKVDEQGNVTSLSSDGQDILQKLVDEYIGLSGEIVKNILGPVFAKYPDIKLNFE